MLWVTLCVWNHTVLLREAEPSTDAATVSNHDERMSNIGFIIGSKDTLGYPMVW